MKKIFIIALMFICCSCSCVATITTFDDNGSVCNKWENVIITTIKPYGISFYDTSNDTYIIINNAVPCLIEYKNYTEKCETEEVNNAEKCETEEELINKYYEVLEEEKDLRRVVIGMDKNDAEYEVIKRNIIHNMNVRKNIKQKLFEVYNVTLTN